MFLNKKQCAAALCLSGLSSVSFHSNAEVLDSKTSFNLGYIHEFSSRSEDSGKYSLPIFSIVNKTTTDWGGFSIGGQIDNLFQVADDLEGEPGNQSFKAFSTVNYNLGDSGFKLWYENFAVGSLSMFEMTNYLGVTYAKSFGDLKTATSVGANYVFGHAGTASNQIQGFNSMAAKFTMSYPINDKLSLSMLFESHINRTDEYRDVFNYDDFGYKLNLGMNYHITDNSILTIQYADRTSWAGYNEGGDSLRFYWSFGF
ncbi:hypothetical protein [Shewanella maritima]|uniref:hypothetical protein n=1 Tax=Shewanella maritima TaxID=2520507 RepID=UPI003736FF15